MDAPRQKIMRTIGENGCYLLCLVHIAEGIMARQIDAVRIYELARELSCRHADGSRGPVITAECYIHGVPEVLTLLCGGTWTVRHAEKDEIPGVTEREILRFEREGTSTTYSHFVVSDGAGHVAYDPLGDSLTVAVGKLVSKRLIKRVT